MNDFRISGAKGQRIETAGQWRAAAPPHDPKEWERYKGRAELAQRWTTGRLDEIDALLASSPPLAGFFAEEGFADRPSQLEEPTGRKRPLDLVVLGSAAGGRTVLVVDGRSDEPWGVSIGEALAETLQRRTGGTREQLESVVAAVFGGPLDPIRELRFTILRLLGAALVEAAAHKCAQAVFVLHEMRASSTPLTAIGKNAVDLDAFARSLSHSDYTGAPPGRLVGPLIVAGGGRFARVPLFIGRAVALLD